MARARFFGPLTVLFACAAQTTAPSTVPASLPDKPKDYYTLSPDDFFKLPEAQARIKKDSVDVNLLDAAIFQQTNRQRIANKLPPFKHSFALQLMARRHSQEMGDLQYFEHESPTPANHSLTDRLRNVGLVNVTAGENIAVLPAKEMGSGSYLITKNADGGEIWTDETTHKVIDYYTYEEIAKAVLDQWMNSPPHHANIVNKAFVYLGAGAARGTYQEQKQDSFYMTQNFSGSITPASEDKARTQLPPATRPK